MRRYEMTLDDWPAILRPLVTAHGPDRVRQAGCELLGFPPEAFGVSYIEFRRLAAALTADGET